MVGLPLPHSNVGENWEVQESVMTFILQYLQPGVAGSSNFLGLGGCLLAVLFAPEYGHGLGRLGSV